jgi:hypothetical protein
MAAMDWRPVGGVERGRLHEARLQAHYALQWPARAARAFVPPQPHDGHTNLGWDDALDGFSTHPLKNGTRLGLRLPDLTLLLLGEDAARAASFSLNGHTDAQARQWLGEQLGARGFDAQALDAPSPYEMPAHALAQGAAYDAAGLRDALAEHAAWFSNAAHLLGPIQHWMAERKLAPSPLRCWPHHFDLATLSSFPARGGATGYVGAGLSPGDHYYDEPYFYVSAYPPPAAEALPALPLGHWHTKDFTGAVATASDILAAEDPKAAAEKYLQAAVEGAVKVLSN